MRQFILVACLAIVSVSAKPGPGYTYNIPAGGGLAANLLPPTTTISQQFAPSHGSLGLSHNSNGASLALGTSYSAAHSHNNFNGHSQGGLLSTLGSHVPSSSYGPPKHHVAAPSFTPTIAIVAPSPSPSYGAPPQPIHSAPASSPSFSVPAPPSPSYGAPPSQIHSSPASSPSFSVPAPPSSSYGAPPSLIHSAPSSSPSFSIPAPPSPSYGAPPSQSFSVVAPAPSSHSSFSVGPASSYAAPASGPVSAPVPSFSVVAPAPSSHSSFSVGPAPSLSSFGSAPSPSFNSFSSVAPSAGAEQTIVQKHIYVHVPPPDVEEQQVINQAPQPVSHQKHYKIIFIKAPSPPSIQEQLIKQQIAQQQQVNEEKTLVYVLVKKPEGLQELRQAAANIQAPQTVQSKPEVYFIKYKAEKGASPSLGSLVGNLPIPSGSNIDLSGLGSSEFSNGASFLGSSELSSASNLSGSSIISSGSGHAGGNTYLPPVENPPPSEVSSGEGSSLSSSSVSEIIQPRTPAPEYGPPKH